MGESAAFCRDDLISLDLIQQPSALSNNVAFQTLSAPCMIIYVFQQRRQLSLHRGLMLNCKTPSSVSAYLPQNFNIDNHYPKNYNSYIFLTF